MSTFLTKGERDKRKNNENEASCNKNILYMIWHFEVVIQKEHVASFMKTQSKGN